MCVSGLIAVHVLQVWSLIKLSSPASDLTCCAWSASAARPLFDVDRAGVRSRGPAHEEVTGNVTVTRASLARLCFCSSFFTWEMRCNVITKEFRICLGFFFFFLFFYSWRSGWYVPDVFSETRILFSTRLSYLIAWFPGSLTVHKRLRAQPGFCLWTFYSVIFPLLRTKKRQMSGNRVVLMLDKPSVRRGGGASVGPSVCDKCCSAGWICRPHQPTGGRSESCSSFQLLLSLENLQREEGQGLCLCRDEILARFTKVLTSVVAGGEKNNTWIRWIRFIGFIFFNLLMQQYGNSAAKRVCCDRYFESCFS